MPFFLPKKFHFDFGFYEPSSCPSWDMLCDEVVKAPTYFPLPNLAPLPWRFILAILSSEISLAVNSIMPKIGVRRSSLVFAVSGQFLRNWMSVPLIWASYTLSSPSSSCTLSISSLARLSSSSSDSTWASDFSFFSLRTAIYCCSGSGPSTDCF